MNQKEKLHILKEIITETKSKEKFNKYNTESEVYLLNDEDKQSEGITSQNDELTSRGLSLVYKNK